MMRLILLFLNACAAGLVLAMSDLGMVTKELVLAAIVLNVLFLFWKSPATSRARQAGGVLSLIGYVGAVATWLILAFGCGIEYSNATCSALVSPLVTVAAVIGLASFPVGCAGEFVIGMFGRKAGG
jgi:hypothetical protein